MAITAAAAAGDATGNAYAVRQVLHRCAQLRRRGDDRQLQRTSTTASIYDTFRAIPVHSECPGIYARTLVLLSQ